jgi:hypothetical protein
LIAGFGFVVEIALVPDDSLVEHEPWVLGVPVARNLENQAVLEGEFSQIGWMLRFLSHRRDATEISSAIGIDHGLPASVQALMSSASRIGKQWIGSASGVFGDRPKVVHRRLGLFGPIPKPQVEGQTETRDTDREQECGHDHAQSAHAISPSKSAVVPFKRIGRDREGKIPNDSAVYPS